MSDRRIEILTSAFHEDPLFAFLWPDENIRIKQTEMLTEFFLKSSSRTYSLETGEGDCAAVLGAFAPYEYPPSFLSSLRLLPGLLRMVSGSLKYSSLATMKKIKGLMRVAESMRPLQPYWYILVVGVDPRYQGRNFGGRILGGIIEKAEGQGVRIYLECSNPRSLDFYGKHGFEVVQEIVPFAGGPPIWGVERKPC